MKDPIKPADAPPGYALVRLINGMWHDGHFDIHVAARPVRDGPALVIVWEGGIPDNIAANWPAIGAALGQQIAEIMAQNEAVQKLAAAAAQEVPGGRSN